MSLRGRIASLFASDSYCVHNNLIGEMIPHLVTNQDNDMLTAMPSLDGVRYVVFGMNNDVTPSPDGYGTHFYQTYWNIVASDVYNSTLAFSSSSKVGCSHH